jgi:hypothetical protein
MKKTFCDICEQPAEEISARISRRIGKEYIKKTDSGVPQGFWCEVVVRVIVEFKDHPGGYVGPPDLCRKCVGLMLNDLRVEFEDGPGMADSRLQRQ